MKSSNIHNCKTRPGDDDLRLPQSRTNNMGKQQIPCQAASDWNSLGPFIRGKISRDLNKPRLK